MSTARPRIGRALGLVAVATAALVGLAACGSSEAETPSSAAAAAASSEVSAAGSGASSAPAAASSAATGKTTTVTVGAHSNGAATEVKIDVAEVDAIKQKLPKEIIDSGKLVIGIGALPAGFPPLAYIGDDEKTITGAEPDFGRLIAAVLGLEPDIENATWENLFVGIDSGKTNVGISNITDTEKRKEKYDFASYRQDNLSFLKLASSDWQFAGDYHNLAGKTVSVGQGTNQEKILLEWQTKLQAEGTPFEVKYYPDTNSVLLALKAGNIDLYFGPNPGSAYQVRLSETTDSPYALAGNYSGAGETLQGLIAATTKKDNGVVGPINEAINYLIENGQYEKWLNAYNLSNEAVATSEINPPGLPLSNS